MPRAAAWMAFTLLSADLVACAPTAPEPPLPPGVTTARALDPVRWQPLSLLPAAAVAPPPSVSAPAFEREPPATDGHSVGDTGHGAIVGAVPLPDGAPGLRVRPVSLARQAHFGAPSLVAMLVKAAERVRRDHPDSVLWGGDLSLAAGGPLSPHKSHTSGRDADLAFYVSRPTDAGLVPADGPAMRYVDAAGRVAGTDLVFDVARNWALVRAFLEDPDATPQWIFVATHLRALLLDEARREGDTALAARAAVVLAQPGDSSPHDDHFHLRIYCGLSDRLEGCLDAPPFRPWAPRYDDAIARWLDALLPFLAEPRLPETKEAIERIVRMNATPAIPHLAHLAQSAKDPMIGALAADALDFLQGRRTPAAWQRWRAEDAPP